MNWKSRPARWAMLAVSPVSRLSTPTTLSPRSSRASARCEPMNPAAPVMTTRAMWEFRLPSVRPQPRLRARPPTPATSVGVLVEEALHERQPHDLEVEHDRPVLDVVEVVLDALLDRGVAAPAIDLRPAGQPGLDLVAQHVLRHALLELLDEERALGPRADQRHVAAEDVPELRDLAQVGAAQELADRRAARVVLAGPDRAGFALGLV